MKTPRSQLALGTPNMSQEHKSSFFGGDTFYENQNLQVGVRIPRQVSW